MEDNWRNDTNYYKRWKYLLMLEKATQCIKSQRVYTFELDDDV